MNSIYIHIIFTYYTIWHPASADKCEGGYIWLWLCIYIYIYIYIYDNTPLRKEQRNNTYNTTQQTRHNLTASHCATLRVSLYGFAELNVFAWTLGDFKKSVLCIQQVACLFIVSCIAFMLICIAHPGPCWCIWTHIGLI